MKKIGIIGLGETVGIAHSHFLGIKKDGRAKIGAVYDVNQELARKWVEERNLDAVVARSMDEFYENVDAVDICSPNFTHFDYTMEAIKRGKDFFVEKPSAINAREAGIVKDAVVEKGQIDMVGFIYRHCDVIRKMKQVVSDHIGKVYSFTSYYGGKRLADSQVPLEWRFVRSLSGSGAINDFASHVVDTASFVAGIEIAQVTGEKNTFIETRPQNRNGQTKVENDDTAVISAKGTNGQLCSITVSRVGMDDMSIIVTGEGGMCSMSVREPEKILLWKKPILGAYSSDAKVIEVERQDYFTGWFEREMTEFIDCLETREKTDSNLKQSFYVSRVLEAIDSACDQGKRITL